MLGQVRLTDAGHLLKRADRALALHQMRREHESGGMGEHLDQPAGLFHSGTQRCNLSHDAFTGRS